MVRCGLRRCDVDTNFCSRLSPIHEGVANALEVALSMPIAEHRKRREAMMGLQRTQDITLWYRNFLTVLRAQS